MEFRFSICVYPLNDEEALALRERLQELLLREMEDRGGLFMGPVLCEKVEVEDGQENIHP